MAHADNLRRHFPAARLTTYLATARRGLQPDVSIQASQQVLEKQLQEGEIAQYIADLSNARSEVKQELAYLLHAEAKQFALTAGLSSAVHTVLYGMDFQPGDEVILHSRLLPDVLVPAFIQKQHSGVKLRPVDGEESPEDWVEKMATNFGKHTRLVVCPQVCPVTGQTLPLESIVQVAHRHGVAVLVDGSHGAGASPVDLEKLKVDFYVCSMKRWLHGPDGTAALYLSDPWLYRLEQSLSGGAALFGDGSYDLSGMYLPADGAARFEESAADLSKWKGLRESLHFLRITAGWEYAFTRIQGLTGELLDGLLDIGGVQIVTPREARSSIVSLRVVELSARKLAENAHERQIALDWVAESPAIQAQNLLRVSLGVYNYSDDVTRVLKFLREAAKGL